jgi:hypothetical protein
MASKSGEPSVGLHDLVNLGIELGLAVNEYNSHVRDNVDDIVRLTIIYVTKVKDAVTEKLIPEEEIPDYFALIGKIWSAVDAGVYSG